MPVGPSGNHDHRRPAREKEKNEVERNVASAQQRTRVTAAALTKRRCSAGVRNSLYRRTRGAATDVEVSRFIVWFVDGAKMFVGGL